MLELLSPAGSPEAVVAAVQNGADAVYLGLEGFNARRGAKNFTPDAFLESLRYCHERGCKVYVTLNTLASDREIDEAARLGEFVSTAGADAVLVQDLGLARVLRSFCPDLPLHASTQMSIHNLAGAHAAAQLGMQRVVLARELSAKQLRFLAERSPIETEVFVTARCASATAGSATCRPSSGGAAATAACAPSPAGCSTAWAGGWTTTPSPSGTTASWSIWPRSSEWA